MLSLQLACPSDRFIVRCLKRLQLYNTCDILTDNGFSHILTLCYTCPRHFLCTMNIEKVKNRINTATAEGKARVALWKFYFQSYQRWYGIVHEVPNMWRNINIFKMPSWTGEVGFQLSVFLAGTQNIYHLVKMQSKLSKLQLKYSQNESWLFKEVLRRDVFLLNTLSTSKF